MLFRFTLFAVLLFCVYACGNNKTNVDEQAPPPPDQSDIDRTVAATCGRCHDGVNQKPALTNGAQFKASAKAKARLEAGTMPPGGGLDARVRQALLTYHAG